MKKIVRLTESELTRVVKYIIREAEESSQMAVQKVMDLSSELGEPIDPEFAQSACDCTIDNAEPGPNAKPEVIELIGKIKEKVKEMIMNKDRGSLIRGFKSLTKEIKKAKKLKNGPINEQGLAAAFVVFGISAPLWVWVAVGGLALYIIIKGIIALSSWIPRSSGHGCSRVVRYRVR